MLYLKESLEQKKDEKIMLKLATAFSGIGAIEQALKQLEIEHEIVFACDNGERYLKATYEEIIQEIEVRKNKNPEITTKKIIEELYNATGKENLVKKSYFANYDIDEERWYEDVRFLDGKKYQGKVDLFVGGSPCQSFSTYGLKKGLEDTRGTLFYDYARLVSEIKPKVFIYENVRGLLSHDKGQTWQIMQDVFKELNYTIYHKVLDAQDYDLPQMRKRIFVVGIHNDIEHDAFEFPEKKQHTKYVNDYLEEKIDDIYYLPEKGFKWVTDWKRNQGKARTNREIMGCQTAIQQMNWSGDFRIEKPQKKHYEDPNIYVGKYEGEDAVARKLTPSECLKLMGFEDFKIVNEDRVIYRQSGNSIAVPVLKELVLQIQKIVKI